MTTVAGAMRRRTLIILGIAAGASALLGAASFIPPGEDLPRAEVGDIVAIFCAGAYGASASPSSFLGQGPAREILI